MLIRARCVVVAVLSVLLFAALSPANAFADGGTGGSSGGGGSSSCTESASGLSCSSSITESSGPGTSGTSGNPGGSTTGGGGTPPPTNCSADEWTSTPTKLPGSVPGLQISFMVHVVYDTPGGVSGTEGQDEIAQCLAYYGVDTTTSTADCGADNANDNMSVCQYLVTYTIQVTPPQPPSGGSGQPYTLNDPSYLEQAAAPTTLGGSIPKIEDFGLSCPGQGTGPCYTYANYPTQLEAASVQPTITNTYGGGQTIGDETVDVQTVITLTLDGYQWCAGSAAGTGACNGTDPSSAENGVLECSTSQNVLLPGADDRTLTPSQACLITFYGISPAGGWPLEVRTIWNGSAVTTVTINGTVVPDEGASLNVSQAAGDPVVSAWSAAEPAYVGGAEAVNCQQGVSC